MNTVRVNAHNEWDPLQEVIVGIAANARYPKDDFAMKASIAYEEKRQLSDITMPTISETIIAETNEDLDIFVKELQKLNITVRRPEPMDTLASIRTASWETTQYFNYCPRDTLLVVGDTIIESPNVYRSRYFETFSYRNLLVEYLKSGCRWISAPKPRLRDEDFDLNPQASTVLKNTDPVFEAANIIRAGKDIFYLVSNSGNELGLVWLKSILGDQYRIHPLRSIYSGTHIDTTLAFLKPGLMLANPHRVNSGNLPSILKEWEIIYAPDMEEYAYSNTRALSSKWLGMNLFMVNPTLAVVDAHQKGLIKLLEKHKIDVLPLKLRHGRQLEGGFHCITLDVNRTGICKDYFM